MRSTFNILFYVKFEDDNLAFVRDIFVFVCFTALSFIDVKNLTTDNIVDINGDKWIISKRHKTNIPFQVKLMEVPLQIIDRYKHLQEDKLVFGKMRSTLVAWLVQELLVNVQEAEDSHDSLWHRESHILPLWKALVRNLGTFKGNAY